MFIRAPWIERVGEGVEVLAEHDGHIVAARQGDLLATTFHPELTGDPRIHRYFIDEVVGRRPDERRSVRADGLSGMLARNPDRCDAPCAPSERT